MIIAIMMTMATMKRIRKSASEVFCSVGRGPTDINIKFSSLQRPMSSFSIAGLDFRLSKINVHNLSFRLSFWVVHLRNDLAG